MSDKAAMMVRGMDLGTSFLSALTKGARKRGISEEIFYGAIKDGSPLIGKFLDLVQEAAKIGSTVFKTILVGSTTDEVVRDLRKSGFWVNNYITQANFPLKPVGEYQEDEIEIVDPGRSFTEEEGLAILKEKGLERPTYEHAIRFASQHGKATTSSEKPFIIFLHASWRDPIGGRRVLYVNRYPDDRELTLRYSGRGFDGRCVLAGVRPRKQTSAS